jgi:hypothetical protein
MSPREAVGLLSIWVLVLTGCATAGGPAPHKVGGPVSRKLLCNEAAKLARFADLGVPADERAVAVAVAGRDIWVLFEPARLLRLRRAAGGPTVQMAVGGGEGGWTSLDVDPQDGSVWVASDRSLALLRFSPVDLQAATVKLARVEGPGGFHRILAGEDALYVEPTAAEQRVWRLDRSGKVLGTFFASPVPPPAGGEPVDIQKHWGRCLSLEKDPSGKILALDACSGRALEADGRGGWAERRDLTWVGQLPSPTPPHTVKGTDVGTAAERWQVGFGTGHLFYWKGRPLVLGPPAIGGKDIAAVVYVADRPGEKILETCMGRYLMFEVAASAESFAAISQRAMVYGDLAAAPDAP